MFANILCYTLYMHVIVLDKKFQKYEKIVFRAVRQLPRFLRFQKPIDIFLIDSRRMRMLNKKFRNKDNATNVLSFQNPKDFPSKTLGEVYLDPRYIEKKRREFGVHAGARSFAHSRL